MQKFLIPGFLFAIFIAVVDVSGQATRQRSTPIPAPTATPSSEPMIISRADEFPDENSQAIPPDPNERRSTTVEARAISTLEELGNRIKNLETGAGAARKVDPDEKQKRLLLNLDILTRAEQRSESLRKQLFEMIEKENTVKTRLDTIDYDLKPEVIERSTNLIGSLRPEEIRASRRKSLDMEKANLQTLLNEITKTRSLLDANLQRSDALVERLRLKFEKEIDASLAEDLDPANPDQN